MTKRTLLLLLSLISLDASAREREPRKTQAPEPAASAPIDERATDKASCAAKWDRYHKSQECFAPYTNVNGSVKPEAFENCAEVKAPTECPL